MKKIITIITTMVIAMSKLISQTTLTAEESNPNKMGWMQGFPPPKDRIISAADGELLMDREVWRAVVHGVAESDTTERLN